MANVREMMREHRATLQAGEATLPGPAVLVTAVGSEEVLLPQQQPQANDKRNRAQRWATQRIKVDVSQLMGEGEERVDRMLALQPLVDDASEILPITKNADNPSPHILIGRAKRDDVLVIDSTVSSVHAQIEDDSEGHYLSDAGSSNGTFVNRRRLAPGERVRLAAGDYVRFGRRVFYYLTGERLLIFLELRIVKQYGTGQRRRTTQPEGEPK